MSAHPGGSAAARQTARTLARHAQPSVSTDAGHPAVLSRRPAIAGRRPDSCRGSHSSSGSRLDGMSATTTSLRRALSERVLIADGAMGTMLQVLDPTLDDFAGLEGCNEILNETRPDIVASVHDAYLAVGVDCVETNTFGANYGNFAEYDIVPRIRDLSEKGARIAREVADGWSSSERPRWVIGSVGPGTKLPSLGHAPYSVLRDAYEAE